MSQIEGLCCAPCRQLDGSVNTNVHSVDRAGNGRCALHVRMSAANIAQEKREGARWGVGRLMLARLGGRNVFN